MSTQNQSPSRIETLLGGKEIVALFMNGREPEKVIRQLPIKVFPELLAIASRSPTDKIAKVMLQTGQDKEWAEA